MVKYSERKEIGRGRWLNMTGQPLVHSRMVIVKIHTPNKNIKYTYVVTPSKDRHEVAREKLNAVRKYHPDAYAEIITTETMR